MSIVTERELETRPLARFRSPSRPHAMIPCASAYRSAVSKRLVIVTGGNAGIGFEIVRALCRLPDHRVVGHALRHASSIWNEYVCFHADYVLANNAPWQGCPRKACNRGLDR